jgi:N-acetylglucosaminyldiphosphoundecaprenol N-acetyl-beta-D-mannosaminyltransferase
VSGGAPAARGEEPPGAGAGRPSPAPPDPPTALLFGLRVRKETMDEAVAAIDRVVRARRPTLHVVINALKASEIARDPEFHRELLRFEMVHADGASVVWASRLLGRSLPERVAGIDLMDRLVRLAAERGHRIFLLGARREVVEKVARVLAEKYPGLRIAGIADGYWDHRDPAAEGRVVATIRESNADMLFVAMPTPRKEWFLIRHRDAMNVPFSMGVGGSFDVIAGVVRRAPLAWQRCGMEWAYRLLAEPRKMWKRYLVTNSHFVWLTLLELAGRGASRRAAVTGAGTDPTDPRRSS